ncbi:MAG: hypothetical protein ACKVS9_03510 [Phycisphaerae bacterium]
MGITKAGVIAMVLGACAWWLLAQQGVTLPPRATTDGPTASQPASHAATRPATAATGAVYTRNYIVQSQVFWPDGRSVGAMVKLVRRTIDPATLTVLEERVVLHPFEPRKSERVTYQIRGEIVSFEAADRSYRGEGLMQGQAGEWTGMTFRSTATAGDSYTKGIERWRDDGLTADLEYFTANGQMRSRMVETGMLLSDDAYNLLAKQLRE